MTWLAMIVLAASGTDLDQIRAEPDPPKRAQKAIDFSGQRLSDARDRASEGDFEGVQAALLQVAEAAELALEATQAKRNVGAMKKVEQKCRDILRRLETLKVDLPVDERDVVDPVEQRVHRVQERILDSIMGRRR
jgi:molecular chaperone GrpE (heat shock protein)